MHYFKKFITRLHIITVVFSLCGLSAIACQPLLIQWNPNKRLFRAFYLQCTVQEGWLCLSHSWGSLGTLGTPNSSSERLCDLHFGPRWVEEPGSGGKFTLWRVTRGRVTEGILHPLVLNTEQASCAPVSHFLLSQMRWNQIPAFLRSFYVIIIRRSLQLVSHPSSS